MAATPHRFRDRCILFFGTVHLAFLAVSILPRPWTESIGVGAVTHAYEATTTCLQDWSMFETIPNIHHLDVRLIVESPGTAPQRLGMRLPGLRPYPQPEHARYRNWATLVLLRQDRSDQREPYMRRVAAELLKSGRYPPEATVRLDCEAWYTRSLLGVRKLREIAVLRPTSMGPFRLADLAPVTPQATNP